MVDVVTYSWGGTVRKTLVTDPSDPYRFAQRIEQVYPERFFDQNRELGETQKGDMKLIARGVPVAVYEQSVREGWSDTDWAKWLNDPDNAAFRVWKGTV